MFQASIYLFSPTWLCNISHYSRHKKTIYRPQFSEACNIWHLTSVKQATMYAPINKILNILQRLKWMLGKNIFHHIPAHCSSVHFAGLHYYITIKRSTSDGSTSLNRILKPTGLQMLQRICNINLDSSNIYPSKPPDAWNFIPLKTNLLIKPLRYIVW